MCALCISGDNSILCNTVLGLMFCYLPLIICRIFVLTRFCGGGTSDGT